VSAHERATDQALRDSQERLRFIYENNPTMYFIVDEAVTIQSVNRFGAEYLGYTVSELEGRSILTVVYVDDHDLVRKNLAECARAAGQVSQWEFRKVRKDGSVLWVRELVRGVRDNDSGAVTFLIVCEDITSERRAATSQRFLSDAGRLLSSSLDYERTLRSVAHLAIPTVADYCIINMLDDAG